MALILMGCECTLSLPSTPYSFIENNPSLQLSSDLLHAVKVKNDYTEFIHHLATIELEQFKSSINSDEKKMIFWINIYNAFIQIELTENPEQYKTRERFFSKKRIKVSGLLLSFDDIEHIILRANEYKFGLGHIKNPFSSSSIKDLAVESKDPRLHFALNCGAASCPPIAIFTAQNFNTQIENVSKRFLETQTTLNQHEKEITVTPLFRWFAGDFCHRAGTLEILKHYGIIPLDHSLALKYSDYDWNLSLGNYYED